MIDLETLGTTPDSAILAIGVVIFCPLTGKQGKEFYETINFEDANHRKIDASTVKWWMEQDDAARKSLTNPSKKPISLNEALLKLKEFLPTGVKVWGNGATFDISMLEHAYNYAPPWKFWNIRDVRTVVDLASDVVNIKKITFDGIKHGALYDAKHQAKYVSTIFQKLKK